MGQRSRIKIELVITEKLQQLATVLCFSVCVRQLATNISICTIERRYVRYRTYLLGILVTVEKHLAITYKSQFGVEFLKVDTHIEKGLLFHVKLVLTFWNY